MKYYEVYAHYIDTMEEEFVGEFSSEYTAMMYIEEQEAMNGNEVKYEIREI